jgi:hypothetical protein
MVSLYPYWGGGEYRHEKVNINKQLNSACLVTQMKIYFQIAIFPTNITSYFFIFFNEVDMVIRKCLNYFLKIIFI